MLLTALAGAAAAFGVSKLLQPQYVSSAELYLAPAANAAVGLQDILGGQNLAPSYVQLAVADVVLEPAAKSIDWQGSLAAFRGATRVQQVRDTSIITISFTSDSRAVARDAANAIADSFINQSQSLVSSIQGSAISQLDGQIVSVQRDIDDLNSQIAAVQAAMSASPRPSGGAAPGDNQAAISRLDESRQTKQQTLARLLSTRNDMRLAIARASSTVSLWQPATESPSPVSPRTLMNTLVGFVSGLLVAMIVVAAFSYIGDRIEDTGDVEPRLGVAPLGQVLLGDHPESFTGKLFVRDSPSSAEAEAFRAFRANIQFASVDKVPRTVLVTSASPGEGKSVVSANLALCLAEAGAPTVLIDADLRRPSQHRLFRTSGASGLTTLLADPSSLHDLQRFNVAPHLLVIPSGPLPPNPAEILASERMSSLLSQLAGGYTVVIDTSPVLATADAIALANRVDGCVVVVDARNTRAASAVRVIEALRRVNARVLGALLNKMDVNREHYYYYSGAPISNQVKNVAMPGSTRRGS